MSQLGVILQDSVQREREARTILGLLTEQMDGVDSGSLRRRRTLKERLGLKGIGCCGAIWDFRPNTVSVSHDEDEEVEEQQQQAEEELNSGLATILSHTDCVSPIATSSGMNLAAALAAERQFRTSQDPDDNNASGGTAAGTPSRVSLMRLLEETDGRQREGLEAEKEGGGALGTDHMCCVCMAREKGAALIPCGHTFCRVCSRDLWLNRGSCPLCNRSIFEILDIF